MRVDAHVHVYPDRAAAHRDEPPSRITEYGFKAEVRRGARDGTLDDVRAALDAGDIAFACVLNVFELPGLPWPPGWGRWPADVPALPEQREALLASNAWVCALADAEPRLLPFVTVHPAVMSARACGEHVATLADAGRARGVKLHTIAQRIHPDDPALWPTYAAVAERGLPLVAHCGPDRHGAELATPAAWARVAEAFPRLQLVLAHLGGAAWRDVAAFAAAYPSIRFDASVIVSWAGSSLGPSPAQLTALIREIGPERVLFGSNFPTYEPAEVLAAVEGLPGLGAQERQAILGENAAHLLGLRIGRFSR